MNKVILLLMFLFLISCKTSKILVTKYNNTVFDTEKSYVKYYLPKKLLKLTIEYKVFARYKTLKDNTGKEIHKLIDGPVFKIEKPIKIEEIFVPDLYIPFKITYQKEKCSRNDLNSGFCLDNNGILLSVNSENVDRATEIAGKVFTTAVTTISLAGKAFSMQGLTATIKDAYVLPDGKKEEITIENYTKEFTKVIDPLLDSSIEIKVSDFVKEINSGPIIIIKFEKTLVNSDENKNPISIDGIYEGVIFRNPILVKTIIKINDTESDLLKIQPMKEIKVFDDNIMFPQFGNFCFAKIQQNKAGKIATKIEFNSNGGIKNYELKNETKLGDIDAINNSMTNLQKTILELKYDNKIDLMKKEKELLELKKQIEKLKDE